MTWFEKIENNCIKTVYPEVNRFEVIDHLGRSYTTSDIGKIEFSVQDEGNTLKVFIKKGNL